MRTVTRSARPLGSMRITGRWRALRGSRVFCRGRVHSHQYTIPGHGWGPALFSLGCGHLQLSGEGCQRRRLQRCLRAGASLFCDRRPFGDRYPGTVAASGQNGACAIFDLALQKVSAGIQKVVYQDAWIAIDPVLTDPVRGLPTKYSGSSCCACSTGQCHIAHAVGDESDLVLMYSLGVHQYNDPRALRFGFTYHSRSLDGFVWGFSPLCASRTSPPDASTAS